MSDCTYINSKVKQEFRVFSGFLFMPLTCESNDEDDDEIDEEELEVSQVAENLQIPEKVTQQQRNGSTMSPTSALM